MWRTDKFLRRLEAQLIVCDKTTSKIKNQKLISFLMIG